MTWISCRICETWWNSQPAWQHGWNVLCS